MRTVLLIAAALIIVVGLTAWLGLREPAEDGTPPGAPAASSPDRDAHEGIKAPDLAGPPPSTAPRPPADGAPWKLSVVVEDEAGKPLDGARVFFIGVEKTETRTGGDGRANLSVRGSGALGVVHRARAPRRIDGLAPPDSGERHLVVALGAGRTIEGVVLDPEGDPVDRRNAAKLRAEPADPDPWYGEPDSTAFGARTGADGGFSIRFLPPGRFRIVVKSVKGSRFAPPKEPILANAGDAGVTIRLEPVLSLRLRLIDDATGAPVTAHTSIRAGTEPDEVKWVFGQHEGVLTLEGLPAREVRLDVEAQGFAPIRSLKAEAEEGEPSRDVTVRLRRGKSPRLTVMVEDASGEPLTRIRVTRTTVIGGVTTSMNEDYEAANGRFEVPISPGRHRLRFGSTGENDLIPSDVSIEAKAGEVIEKSVRLALGGSIWIAGEDLEFESGGRTTRRTVRVLAEGGARLRPETKEHPAGGLHFRRLPPGVVVLSWNRGGEAVRTRVTVVAGETLRARLR